MEEGRSVLTIGGHKRPVIRRPNASINNNKNGSRRCSSTASRATLRPLPAAQQKEAVSRSQSSASHRPNPPVQQPSTEECTKLRDELLQTKNVKPVDDEDLRSLIPYLRDHIIELSLNEKYDEASKESEIVELAKNELYTRKHTFVPGEDAATIMSPQREAITSDYEGRINNLKTRLNEKEKRLIEQQNEEKASFESTWSDEMPRRYRKPSQKLLEIKEMERFLALSNDFEGAKKLHGEAEVLSLKETQEAQRCLVHDYRQAKSHIETRHRQALENLNTIRERKVALLEQQMKMKLKELDKREHVLQMKAKENETCSKERSDPYHIKTSYGGCRRRVKPVRENLLGNLIPPNDPKFIQEEKRLQAERRKRQEEFQKKANEDLYGEEEEKPEVNNVKSPPAEQNASVPQEEAKEDIKEEPKEKVEEPSKEEEEKQENKEDVEEKQTPENEAENQNSDEERDDNVKYANAASTTDTPEEEEEKKKGLKSIIAENVEDEFKNITSPSPDTYQGDNKEE